MEVITSLTFKILRVTLPEAFDTDLCFVFVVVVEVSQFRCVNLGFCLQSAE